jgi:nucleotide-binding universal stress UspA family protein
MKRIIIGLDGSLPARQALEWALLLGRGEAELHLVHGYDTGYFYRDAHQMYGEDLDRAAEQGAALLGAAAAGWAPCGRGWRGATASG